jgi:cellulose synthase/poly-beta-1,6-N-acetylglucosamine synthase-like glycosyltransferase
VKGASQTGDDAMRVGGRPCVSVVVPFRGDEADALRAATALRALNLRAGDQLIVADNTTAAVAAPALSGVATVVRAGQEESSYHARNAGAAAAGCPWLLFCDADCTPEPDLLDRYFEPLPDARTGLVAGSIADHPDHGSLLGRYASSRELYQGSGERGDGDGDYAPSGNLLVRAEAFESVGGFTEGIRSAGDVDLCWAVQRAGWGLERRPAAVVSHRHREDLRSFLGMLARYGAGSAWLDRRYPGSSPRWPLSARELARAGADSARHALGGRGDEAAFRIVDALGLLAHNVGYRASNEVSRDSD